MQALKRICDAACHACYRFVTACVAARRWKASQTTAESKGRHFVENTTSSPDARAFIVGKYCGSTASAINSLVQPGGVGCCFPNLQARRLWPQRTFTSYVLGDNVGCCQRIKYACASFSCSFSKTARCHLLLIPAVEGIHCVCISSRVIDIWIPKILVSREAAPTP